MPFTSGSIPKHVTNVGTSASSSHPKLSDQEEEVELKRSKRQKVTKDFGSDFITFQIEGDPPTFKDAMASSEVRHWKEAIKSEMDSILVNGTWELVVPPPDSKTIGCK